MRTVVRGFLAVLMLCTVAVATGCGNNNPAAPGPNDPTTILLLDTSNPTAWYTGYSRVMPADVPIDEQVLSINGFRLTLDATCDARQKHLQMSSPTMDLRPYDEIRVRARVRASSADNNGFAMCSMTMDGMVDMTTRHVQFNPGPEASEKIIDFTIRDMPSNGIGLNIDLNVESAGYASCTGNAVLEILDLTIEGTLR